MNTPIRVLHVLGKLHRGGAETMVMNLYRNIDKEKIQFDFVVHTEKVEAYENEIHNLGGKIFRIPAYKGYNHFEYIHAWKELLSNHPEFKIIHGHVRSTASIYMLIAKQYNRITISHSHSTSNGSGFSAVIKNIMQLPIRYIPNYFFAPTLEAGRWLFGNKVTTSDRFYILKNAIDSDLYRFDSFTRDKIRTELGIKENTFVIGHIGRFVEVKNHHFIIDIFNEYLKINKNSILLLIGDGENRINIERKINDLNLNKFIILMGERSDIPQLLQAIDFFLFPSIYEGLGMSAIEAQAAGLPCLVSKNVPNEISITSNVIFCSLKTPTSYWASIINKTIDNYNREDTSFLIKKDGYEIRDTVKWLENFYKTVDSEYFKKDKG